MHYFQGSREHRSAPGGLNINADHAWIQEFSSGEGGPGQSDKKKL